MASSIQHCVHNVARQHLQQQQTRGLLSNPNRILFRGGSWRNLARAVGVVAPAGGSGLASQEYFAHNDRLLGRAVADRSGRVGCEPNTGALPKYRKQMAEETEEKGQAISELTFWAYLRSKLLLAIINSALRLDPCAA